MSNPLSTDTITLAGGCFWCIEAVFKQLEGVLQVESGYSGGNIATPTYREVCSGRTGHAEVVQIVFDPQKISLDQLLSVFWNIHNPTTLNRQGADVGTQYRSAIFYRTEEQRIIAENSKRNFGQLGVYNDPIVTEITPFKVFYKAEDYHQDYFALNGTQPYCEAVVRPKVEKFQHQFENWLKKH
ncbi:MAG TPA: peptide-methionine (S)-S-oxide reductase MsrA [Chitinophagales bacterium]|nr:peptide-methionine (S)-S-oxide reductase MsrA [Chitinophagales bacterium]